MQTLCQNILAAPMMFCEGEVDIIEKHWGWPVGLSDYDIALLTTPLISERANVQSSFVRKHN